MDPLSLVRQRPITILDFEPYKLLPTLAKHTLQSVHQVLYWKMGLKGIDLQRLLRRKAFVSKILADFAFQWRNVLCGIYNSTFRRLAYAIVRIVTLDFTVEEVTLSRQGIGGFLVWIDNLPEWDFANGHIVRVGRTSIVMCEHAPHAVTMIRKDFAKQTLSFPDLTDKSLNYLILTVRELILYRINSEQESYTEPKQLFHGTSSPSEEAINLLLEASQSAATMAPLRNLPVELQDAILVKVSAGPIESARMSCLLDVGSVFTWKCGKRNIEREEGRRSRTPWTPVESHICFGSCCSGVAYK